MEPSTAVNPAYNGIKSEQSFFPLQAGTF